MPKKEWCESTTPSFIDAIIRGSDKKWVYFVTRYTEPSKSLLRSMGAGEDSEDLWWNLVHRWYSKDKFNNFNPERGFRKFLKASVRHLNSDHYRRTSAKKRGSCRTISSDNPLTDENGNNRTMVELLEDSDEGSGRREEELEQMIKVLLENYSKPDEVPIYWDWFWKTSQSDEKIAEKWGISRNQLRSLRDRVNEHLCARIVEVGQVAGALQLTDETFQKALERIRTRPKRRRDAKNVADFAPTEPRRSNHRTNDAHRRHVLRNEWLESVDVPTNTPCLIRRQRGGEDLEVCPLRGEMIIGREGDGVFRYPSEMTKISKRHFRVIVKLDGGCVVQVFKEKNALYVNGQRVESAERLFHGDHLYAGEQEFVFANRVK